MTIHRESYLADYACKSADTAGRIHPEHDKSDRLAFELDRDRIIHCKAFRRLDQKTQVLVAGSGDHYRTRLTHTLEVAQVARGLARSLRLNEDLSEAIALAHDLGHPPFGHAGEYALDAIVKNFGFRFEHNEQSRRIVEKLEKSHPHFDGLNLTKETLDGLIKHQTAFDQAGKEFETSAHLEAQAVNFADEIAYTTHDVDDGLRAELLSLKKLKSLAIWQKAAQKTKKLYGSSLSDDILITRIISELTAIMMNSLIAETKKRLKTAKNFPHQILGFDPETKEIIQELRDLLYHDFYLNPAVVKEVQKGEKMIKKVFDYYYQNPDQLPPGWEQNLIGVKDYIAGMTDHFLLKEYNKL